MSSHRLAEFETRIARLKCAMESGLGERARTFRELAQRVEAGDSAARTALKTESHKLRGLAGSYGHADLTALAAEVEQHALASPSAGVGELARALAALCDEKGRPAAEAPAERPHTTVVGRTENQSAVLAPYQLRVLAIDDDAVTQRLLALALQQVGGFDATIVGSAYEALELMEQHQYDVVVSDAMMPDMNGLEFRRAARARGATVPIVMLSAASPDELGWSLKSESASEWLRKPFKPRELVRELLAIVARRR